MFRNLIILLLLCLGFWQCTENVSNLEEEMTRDYFPVKVGNYWIYDVTETSFINRPKDQPNDSVRYQVRERVDSIFLNQSKEPTFRVIRSWRANANQAWGRDSIVLINKTFSHLRYTRNNRQTVRLVFPVRADKKWNGNAFNNLGEEEYSYADVGKPFPMGDTTFQNTVRVVQFFNENLVELDDRQEVFALGVGMIYKKTIDYDFCRGGSGQNCQVGTGFVVKGKKRIQKLRAFGTGS